ncbi:putative RTA1 domain protein [Polyplosphaeria fusca]|uniref:RTA1 domain protein n=1 Tax=Polyplosphaeria fusca TaxID=682080 RepID=A0A9P4QJK5_9PLEO|nr:putative RTA1 domain protein [Polyplosphaeria fusca]
MAGGDPIVGSLYVYAPNRVAPVFFTTAYALSAIGHIWQCRRYNSWKLVGLHPLCAVMFTVGYALREYGSFNYIYDENNATILITFIMSQVFIFVCPPLLELANYHVLGRIFYYVPHLPPVPPNRVLTTFGALMALIEFLNSLGVSLSANPSSSHSQQELGKNMSLAALILQLIIIASFVALAGIFHRRCIKTNIHAKAVLTPLYTLYTSMALILIRCIYRLVEHTGNTNVDLDNLESLRQLSPILRYEWYFYIFEATLMLLNSVLWNVWHPGRYLPEKHNIHLARDGVTEIEGEEQKDQRSLLLKLLSVLTFGLLFRKKTQRGSFEELQEYRGLARRSETN